MVFPEAEWEKSAPVEFGLCPDALEDIGRKMELAQANGVLCCKGRLVAEWNYAGPPDKMIEVQSITKAVTGTILGLAIQDKLIPHLDVRVKDYWPGFNGGPYEKEITFRHLISATSGLKPTRQLSTYLHDDYRKPGMESSYHNDHTMNLADALTYLFQQDLELVLNDRVLKPIGAGASWGSLEPPVKLADGRDVRRVAGFCNTWWTSGNLARLGHLYLNSGAWNGKQIIPGDYARECFSPVGLPVLPFWKPFPDPERMQRRNYSLAWWAWQANDGRWLWYMFGHGGQFCLVMRENGIVMTNINDCSVRRSVEIWDMAERICDLT